MKKVKALLYCTKAKPFLFENKNDNQVIYDTWQKGNLDCWRISQKKVLNGKIVAKCEVETEKIKICGDEIRNYFGNNAGIDIEEKACLKFEQIEQYLCSNEYKGYALHISNLKIFDKPKGLFEYNTIKAPQNMMYAYDENGNEYVLISIRSEWLCKILNGEKTIEVRKKVLKEML